MLAYLDSITGEVIGHDRNGCYVRLDTEEPNTPYGFYFGSGRTGDRVLLSVKRINSNHSSIFCILESVLSYAPPADTRRAA